MQLLVSARDTFVLPAMLVMMLVSNMPVMAQIELVEEEAFKISGKFHIESGTNQGFLILKLELPDGSHIYSLTQPAPLIPTKLTVKQHKQFKVEKAFQADTKPQVIEHDPVFETRVEKYQGVIQFFVPITVDPHADPKKLQPEVSFSAQICSEKGFCKLINDKTPIEFAGYFQREAKKKATLPEIKRK